MAHKMPHGTQDAAYVTVAISHAASAYRTAVTAQLRKKTAQEPRDSQVTPERVSRPPRNPPR